MIKNLGTAQSGIFIKKDENYEDVINLLISNGYSKKDKFKEDLDYIYLTPIADQNMTIYNFDYNSALSYKERTDLSFYTCTEVLAKQTDIVDIINILDKLESRIKER